MTGRDRSLDMRCTTCGAAPGEECETNSGHVRFEPHSKRMEAMYTRDFFRNRVVLPAILLRCVGKTLPSQKKENWIAKSISLS
jgi:hypothetical protein